MLHGELHGAQGVQGDAQIHHLNELLSGGGGGGGGRGGGRGGGGPVLAPGGRHGRHGLAVVSVLDPPVDGTAAELPCLGGLAGDRVRTDGSAAILMAAAAIALRDGGPRTVSCA